MKVVNGAVGEHIFPGRFLAESKAAVQDYLGRIDRAVRQAPKAGATHYSISDVPAVKTGYSVPIESAADARPEALHANFESHF